jgi:hypothetical protein
MHGQYAIIAIFSLIYSIYLFLSGKEILSTIPLALATSIYYYPAILYPLFFLAFSNKFEGKLINRRTLKYLLSLLLFTILFFVPFLFGHHLQGLLNSLLHHAQPDAPEFISEISLPNYSLFKFPFFLIFSFLPTNITAPGYFNFISKSTLLSFLFVFIYQAILYLRYFFAKKVIPYSSLLKHTLSILIIFLVFLAKFQDHYLLWVACLLLLYSVIYANFLAGFSYFFISFIPIISFLGEQNLGVYFLDSVRWGNINLWLNYSEETNALLGFLVVLLLVIFLIILAFGKNKLSNSKISYRIYLFGGVVSCIAIFSIYYYLSIGYKARTYRNPSNFLADKSILNFSMQLNNSSLVKQNDDKTTLVRRYDFNDQASTFSNIDRYYQSSSNDKQALYFYNIDNNPATFAVNREGNLEIIFEKPNTEAQLSFGSNKSPYLFAMQKDEAYKVRLTIRKDNHLNVSIKARLADFNKKINSEFDKDFTSISNDNGWETLESIISSSNLKDKYFELAITAKRPADDNTSSIRIVDLKNLYIYQMNTDSTYNYTFYPTTDGRQIQNNIMDNNSIKDQFVFNATVSNLEHFTKITDASLNNCPYYELISNGEEYNITFDPGCATFLKPNKLQINFRSECSTA